MLLKLNRFTNKLNNLWFWKIDNEKKKHDPVLGFLFRVILFCELRVQVRNIKHVSN